MRLMLCFVHDIFLRVIPFLGTCWQCSG